MIEPLTRFDIILLIIAAAGSKGLTPVQLQKSAFLIGKSKLSVLPKDFYPFYAYNYGPFNPEVYQDADELEKKGLIVQAQEPGRSWARYVITLAGTERAEELKHQIDPKASAYVQAVVEWVKSLTFSELLRAIYAKYPDMRENSVFQG